MYEYKPWADGRESSIVIPSTDRLLSTSHSFGIEPPRPRQPSPVYRIYDEPP